MRVEVESADALAQLADQLQRFGVAIETVALRLVIVAELVKGAGTVEREILLLELQVATDLERFLFVGGGVEAVYFRRLGFDQLLCAY